MAIFDEGENSEMRRPVNCDKLSNFLKIPSSSLRHIRGVYIVEFICSSTVEVVSWKSDKSLVSVASYSSAVKWELRAALWVG